MSGPRYDFVGSDFADGVFAPAFETALADAFDAGPLWPFATVGPAGRATISTTAVRIVKPSKLSGTLAVSFPECRTAVLVDSISRTTGPSRIAFCAAGKSDLGQSRGHVERLPGSQGSPFLQRLGVLRPTAIAGASQSGNVFRRHARRRVATIPGVTIRRLDTSPRCRRRRRKIARLSVKRFGRLRRVTTGRLYAVVRRLGDDADGTGTLDKEPKDQDHGRRRQQRYAERRVKQNLSEVPL